MVRASILELPLDVVEAIIETLEKTESLESVEVELLEALREIRPLLIEVNNAKLN